MNINQKQTILHHIDEINRLDLEQKVIAAYGDVDYKQTMVNNYSIEEFLKLLRKMLSQLKSELENGYGLILPNQENFQNDFGAIQLDSELAIVAKSLNDANFPAAEGFLNKFIHYQIRFGFWDKSKVKFHNVDSEKLIEQQNVISLTQRSLENEISTFENLKRDIINKQNEVNEFVKENSDLLDKISERHEEAIATAEEISEIKSRAKLHEEIITEKRESIGVILASAEDDVADTKSKFTQTLKEVESHLIAQKNINKESNDILIKVREGIDFIESKRNDIVHLTGMAADGSLGSKFKVRQEDLEKGLKFWQWGIPAMTVVVIVWSILVFTLLKADFKNEWINMGVNLLKTTPVFIVWAFFFKQYSKERNLQEEYAFKSAVAMTLTAYSNMLESADDPKNKSRQEMLLRSIEQVYSQPKIHNENKSTKIKIPDIQIKEAVQEVVDTVKKK